MTTNDSERAMNHDSQMAIIINDLDSLRHRIEALPAHPRLTDALNNITDARDAVTEARVALHRKALSERYDI